MTFKYSIRTALRGLHTNKSRSALTIFGIVIGITAIILVMSLSQGGSNLILAQIQGIGSRTIAVEPGREPKGPTDFAQIFSDSLKDREVEALQNKANVPTLLDLTPEVIAPATLAYEDETFRANILGTGPIWQEILDLFPRDGSFFTEDDVRQRASVVVIGSRVKEQLFGDSDALGKKIKVKGRNFRVIGIFPQKGQTLFNIDELAVAPYTTVQRYILGTNHYNAILARAASESVVNRTKQDIELTLRELHGISDPAKDDFHVMTQTDAADRVGIITGILSALLISVAAISLVVGGVGIMNIMLVSVTERTREIGLRKAIGARDRDILLQFLFEAVMLTLAGGIIGMALGAASSFAVAIVLRRVLGVVWPFVFPVSAAVLGFGVSAFIGLVFGLYPARQASQKSPIEALRHE